MMWENELKDTVLLPGRYVKLILHLQLELIVEIINPINDFNNDVR